MSFLFAKSLLASLIEFWNKLPSPVKAVIIGLIFGFVCFKMGEHKAQRICEAQKQESIAEARRIDTEANATAIKDAKEQSDKYQKQALETENKLNAAREYYASLPDKCKIDNDFINRNNSIGDSDGVSDELPGSKKRTPRSR